MTSHINEKSTIFVVYNYKICSVRDKIVGDTDIMCIHFIINLKRFIGDLVKSMKKARIKIYKKLGTHLMQ